MHIRLDHGSAHHTLGLAARTGLLTLCLLTGLSSATAQSAEEPAGPSAGFSAGVSAHGRTTEADVGLPAYPGAVPRPDPGNEGAGASLGLWGGPLGIQLHVLKLHSNDPVDSVARFYRSALERQGAVLDCLAVATAEQRSVPPGKGEGDKVLRCGSDRPKVGGRILKAGTPARMRMVVLEPAEGGTHIQLVRLDLRGE